MRGFLVTKRNSESAAPAESGLDANADDDLNMDDDTFNDIMERLDETIEQTAQETAKEVAQERREELSERSESTPPDPEDDVEAVEKSANPLAKPFSVRDAVEGESRAAVKKRLGDRKDRFRKRHKERTGMSDAKFESLTGDPVGDAIAPDDESSEEVKKHARRASNTFVADALARQ